MPEAFVHPIYRFFAPEVIQTSAMDCGPAALKCLLEGFGIPVSYGRLREACQTAVDGTSIDTIEDVAYQLGLQAQQVIAPINHLLLPEANLLPALVVTRLPDGLPHFIIVWRVVGPWVQVMDPATGRRWVPRQQLLQDLYRHAIPFPAGAWRAWAGGPGFVAPLRMRLEKLRLPADLLTTFVAQALADEHWKPLATLDAAARFVETLVQAGGVQRGQEATQLLTTLVTSAEGGQSNNGMNIPTPFWFVQQLLPSRTQGPDAPEQLLLRGAVLIRVQGRRTPVTSGEREVAAASAPEPLSPPPLSPALAAALREPPNRPEWAIWRTLRADGLFTPALLLLATLLAAVMVTMETVLLRSLLTLAPMTDLLRQMLLGGIALFTLLLLAIELPLTKVTLRMGRRLETRLRMALLRKLPRLGDQYFRSRLISDMATRAYGLQRLHNLPELALRTIRLSLQMLLTAVALLWLYPASAPLAFLATGFVLGTALLTQPLLSERDLRVRTHTGALSRFYLDALLGLTPVRTHSATRTVRREHEMRLVAWARANLAFYDLQRLITAVVTAVSTGFAIAIVLRYLAGGGEASGVLLLLYWTLNLTTLGQALLTALQQYPIQRNHVLRLLEPLGAPSEDDKEIGRQGEGVTGWQGDQGSTAPSLTPSPPHLVTPSPAGIAIELRNVTVVAGGHTILTDLNLQIGSGEHVAIVGPSGAGKSSLVGLLLGWQRPASGQLWVDGAPLDGSRLPALRRVTAWVDPAIHLWNRTLFANLLYGTEAHGNGAAASGVESAALNMTAVLDGADLYDVLEKLPAGLQTPLGESGGLVSGGEGQRVRLGRALLRTGVRLAILDEPFRGLDRGKRQQLLRNARAHWAATTLLCITHDISATQDFTRVLVVDQGRIVEDGAPATLLAQPQSRYRALLAADETVRQTLWQGSAWRRLALVDGLLHEEKHADTPGT